MHDSLQVSSIIQTIETMSFDRTIQAKQKDKFNSMEISKKFKMFPKCKVRMNILLCIMISMLVVHPTFKIDMLKMEQAS